MNVDDNKLNIPIIHVEEIHIKEEVIENIEHEKRVDIEETYVKIEQEQTPELADNETKNWKCTLCPFSTKWPRSLNRHVSKVHIETNIVQFVNCDECGFKTNKERNLFLHKIRKHASQNINKEHEEYCCHNCDYKTVLKCNLRAHIRHSHSAKAHQCEDCDYQTSSATQFKFHRYKHLPEEQVPYIHCAHCSFKTLAKCHLEKHFRNVHPPTHSIIKCDFCDFEDTKNHVEKHVNNAHHKEFKIKKHHYKTLVECEHCNYKTKSELYLLIHYRRTHGPQGEFCCDKCDFKTNTRWSFYTHFKKIHMWLRCDKCNYKSKNEQYLTIHKKTHHTIEYFECPHCDFQASIEENLKLHMRIKHLPIETVKTFVCTYCKFKAPTEIHLKRHVLKHKARILELKKKRMKK